MAREDRASLHSRRVQLGGAERSVRRSGIGARSNWEEGQEPWTGEVVGGHEERNTLWGCFQLGLSEALAMGPKQEGARMDWSYCIHLGHFLLKCSLASRCHLT